MLVGVTCESLHHPLMILVHYKFANVSRPNVREGATVLSATVSQFRGSPVKHSSWLLLYNTPLQVISVAMRQLTPRMAKNIKRKRKESCANVRYFSPVACYHHYLICVLCGRSKGSCYQDVVFFLLRSYVVLRHNDLFFRRSSSPRS